ncbi:hypothetical protein MMC27_003460 [Xylographa pallens]|nr:hypothetical protein [Xylographa pallens]
MAREREKTDPKPKEIDWKQKMVSWQKKGSMTPEQIIQRLDAKLETYGFYEKLAAIQKNFDSVCVENKGIKHLNEAGFVKFLARAFPTSFDPFVDAGPILYTSAVYLARFPFMTGEPSLLTFAALVRALALMLPDKANCWCAGHASSDGRDERLISRERSAIDQIRLFFQSLADKYEDSGPECEEILVVAERPNQPIREPAFQVPNNDQDGDEMYHDILDVLSATQPGKEYEILCSRDNLRPLATKLWQTDIRLSHYQISRKKIASLLKLLLSMRLSDACHQDAAYSVKAHELDAVTENVVNAFSGKDDDAIAWPVFYNRIIATTPLLLTPLEGLLNLFLETSEPTSIPGEFALPTEATILSLPILSQLSLVLASTITFDGLQLLYHCKLTNASDPEGFTTLVDVLQSYREPCFLLIRGRSDTDDIVTYGAFLPVRGQQPSDSIHRPDLVGSFLFQLSPQHDVFSAPTGEPSWTSFNREIWFGDQDAGVAFGLTDGLKQGIMMHKLTGDGPYKGNLSRREWQMKVRISELEVWMERD